MDSIIEYRVKNQYGTEVFIPTNKSGQILAAIAGHTTITKHTAYLAKELGFTFKLEAACNPL
tara:strand:+ start:437 stop:622 length:186 start_codon:yes stop_codon:yes gene_type:complete